MFWIPSSIFIEEMHMKYEIREQFRNHALLMHYNNSGKLYFHCPEPKINSDTLNHSLRLNSQLENSTFMV